MYLQKILSKKIRKREGSEAGAGSFVRGTDPRIRIRTKMSRIRNTTHTIALLYGGVLRLCMYVKSLKANNSGMQVRKKRLSLVKQSERECCRTTKV